MIKAKIRATIARATMARVTAIKTKTKEVRAVM